MKLHRFYIGERWERQIQHFGQERCWVQDKNLTHQWHKVLRFRAGDEVSLFDGTQEFLYKVAEVKPDETALVKVTELKPRQPKKHVLLAWSLLKKDNNDWVLQKGTEVGVNHFVPLITDRSEKTGFNLERANKIIIEAAEQSGRIDIPVIDEVRSLDSLISTYKGAYQMFAMEQKSEFESTGFDDRTGVIIGPEGGWTDQEISHLNKEKIGSISLGDLTLRAETAAVVAATKVLGITP